LNDNEKAAHMALWTVTEIDAEAIAIGAGILGTGGGGNPYLGKLRLQKLLRAGHTVAVIDIEDLPLDALIVEVGTMGAPTVGIEKLPSADESRRPVEALQAYIGKSIDALICSEIGGANSVEPLIVGALTGKPVVDADGMGCAFPELQMSTHFIGGVACFPAALADEKGNKIVFGHLLNPAQLERFARDICVLMGCRAMYAMALMTGQQARDTSVPRTLSLARKVGEAVLLARKTKDHITDAILAVTDGKALFAGKLLDVQRKTTGGFARGSLRIEGQDAYRGAWLHIAFQNENLIAWDGSATERGSVLACVPDLICLIETDTGEPITTEQLRYGLRVVVLAIPCTNRLRTPEALNVIGPAAFGYPDVDYRPMLKTPGIGIE